MPPKKSVAEQALETKALGLFSYLLNHLLSTFFQKSCVERKSEEGDRVVQRGQFFLKLAYFTCSEIVTTPKGALFLLYVSKTKGQPIEILVRSDFLLLITSRDTFFKVIVK